MLIKVKKEKRDDKVLLVKAEKRDQTEILLVVYHPTAIKTMLKLRQEGQEIFNVKGEAMTFKNQRVIGIHTVLEVEKKIEQTGAGEQQVTERSDAEKGTENTSNLNTEEVSTEELPSSTEVDTDADDHEFNDDMDFSGEDEEEIPDLTNEEDQDEHHQEDHDGAIEATTNKGHDEDQEQHEPENKVPVMAQNDDESQNYEPSDHSEAVEAKKICDQKITYVPIRHINVKKANRYFQGYETLDSYMLKLNLTVDHDDFF